MKIKFESLDYTASFYCSSYQQFPDICAMSKNYYIISLSFPSIIKLLEKDFLLSLRVYFTIFLG